MVAPWQWFVCARELEKGEESYDPDDGAYVAWKHLVGTVGVAEWGWTPKFPTTSFLRYLWFDPFMMLEKEVTW
jgi:hypothetical protein